MSIPAVRFKALDKEMNVGIANFSDIKTSDIFTSPNNVLKKVSSELKSLLDKGKSLIASPLALIKSASDELTRATQDIFSGLKDITNLSPKKIEDAVASMLPNSPIIQNAFKSITQQCKNNGMGKGYSPVKFKDRFGCGNGKGKCSSAEVNGMMNKLTNGALGGAVKSLNDSIKSLLALANMGYDVGLCKVFQSLLGSLNIEKSVASLGAGMLLGQVAAAGNIRGVIDIAASTSGLFPLLHNPGAIGQAVTNFALDKVGSVTGSLGRGLGLTAAAGLMTRFDAGMEILQDGWRTSDTNPGVPSTELMGPNFNQDFSDSLQATVVANPFDTTDLTDSSVHDLAPICAAYTGEEARQRETAYTERFTENSANPLAEYDFAQTRSVANYGGFTTRASDVAVETEDLFLPETYSGGFDTSTVMA